MKASHVLSASALLIAASTPAFAESEGGFDRHVKPSSGIELAVAAGYAQGGGDIGRDMAALDDVAGPGGAVELQVGYRIIPHLTLGVYGSLSAFDQGDALADDTRVTGATAGVQGIWHFRPSSSVAPWVSLGTGWKGLWLSPDTGKTASLQGLELARLQVGVDYRLSPSVAITPLVGGGLSMFLAQDSAMTSDYDEINDKEVSFSLFAGLAGRFNL